MTTDRRVVSFEVRGLPKAKGNARAFIPKGWTRPVITQDVNKQAKGWQQLVSEQAQTVGGGTLFLGPVTVSVSFYLPRPDSLPRRILHHLKKPDIDKLVRGVLDGLTHALYQDDRQVVELHARKRYVTATEGPRAVITLMETGTPDPNPIPGDLFTELVEELTHETPEGSEEGRVPASHS